MADAPGSNGPPDTATAPLPATRNDQSSGTSRRRALLELIALVITSGFWVIAQPLGQQVPILAVLIPIWVAYFAVRSWRRPGLIREWGILPRNWNSDVRLHSIAALVALAFLAILGLAQGTLTMPPHAWLILIAYPPWAWCQQFLLQNVIVANAQRLGVRRALLPLVGAVAFGAAHLDDLPLVGLTMMGGYLWTWLFLRAPNLWLLAISHAVVGTTAFMWVLGRDPLLEYPQLLEWLG